jgi:flagellar motor switch protein FliN/FliY
VNGMLSQEEINALLKENDEQNGTSTANDGLGADLLSTMEIDVLGEFATISMGNSITTLSALIGKKINISTPQVQVTTIDSLKERYPQSYFMLKVQYKKGLEGTNMLILQTYDVGVIVDLMMGGDGSNPPEELSEIHFSAISETMNQMMGASSTSTAQIINTQIDTSPAEYRIVTLDEPALFEENTEEVVSILYQLNIEGLVDSEILQILPISTAKIIVDEVIQHNVPAIPTEENEKSNAVKPQSSSKNTLPKEEIASIRNVEISPAKFHDFMRTEPVKNEPPNLDLIMDIGLQLSVELGRTHKKIKDILELTNGSIIELDKLAGEPVDILVNGKLLAHGEVVVIDENFGVRVTGIISPEERVRSLR